MQDLSQFLALFLQPQDIQIKAIKLTRWHKDENALGSYSNYKVGTTENHFTQLSKPINHALWFIGEHTTPKINSYAHGAYLSG